jgi:hypothetical protein
MLADPCEFKPSLSKTTTNIIYLTPIQLFSNFLTLYPLEVKALAQCFQKGSIVGQAVSEKQEYPTIVNNRKVVP